MTEGEVSQATKDFIQRVSPKVDVKGELERLKRDLDKAIPVDIPNVPIPEGVSIDENGNIVDPERKVLGPEEDLPSDILNPNDFTFNEAGEIVSKEK